MLDGAARLDDLLGEAVKLGMPAIAMTDHGNLYGAYEFYSKAKKHGIKPIIGLEGYYAPQGRFTRAQFDFGGGFDEGTLARRALLKVATVHRNRQVRDEALRARLVPPYPLGCKRIIYSNEFYPALGRPHVELVTEPIERITARGIVTADGRERPIDTLVCATGFDAVKGSWNRIDIRGKDGVGLKETWADGVTTYMGMQCPGFPNFFLLCNPGQHFLHTVLPLRGSRTWRLPCLGLPTCQRARDRSEKSLANSTSAPAVPVCTVWTSGGPAGSSPAKLAAVSCAASTPTRRSAWAWCRPPCPRRGKPSAESSRSSTKGLRWQGL